ncbi:aromatic amino acid transaminase [Marinimicrobium sp. ARAG 43.8]|uniref:amino acid aminotransferase n=1 Tax=Marinimicrobium sp. ARAG 43.8 TaxID=3418719 RepID=UPI003CE79DC5
MFASLSLLPNDPILGLSIAFQRDTHPNKVDLGVGVYRNASGVTPVMAAVREAEQWLLREETSKGYTPPDGYPGSNQAVRELALGLDHPALAAGRVATVQTPGGCGALRLAAELVQRASPGAQVWVSNPTWANHGPLLGNAGLSLKEYPYYDFERHTLDFDRMLAALQTVPAGDIVLLHAACHNPCGADLTPSQWQQVTDLAKAQGFIPFIDMAYQGFGEGLEEDACGPRLMAKQLPEVVLAVSFSKNFGLYRERAGALLVVGEGRSQAEAVQSQLLSVARGLYSMPPAHGSALVATIWQSEALREQWREELAEMRGRIQVLRQSLVGALAKAVPERDFGFIARERGMFSFLGLSETEVGRLQRDFSIYMTDNSRINVAGLNQDKVDYVAEAVARVLNG